MQTGSLRSRTGVVAALPRVGVPARVVPWSKRLQALGAPACLIALTGAAALNGLPVRILGLSVYPEYIALGVVLVWAAGATVVERRGWYLPPSAVALAAWLAAELAATLLHAPTLHHSLVLWLKLPMLVATYLLVANLARNRLGQAIATQGTIAATVGLGALLCYVSWKATGSHLGMQQPARNFGVSWLPAVTLREPDILGSYLVAGSLLLMPLAVGLWRTGRRHSVAIGVACVLTVAGTFVSGSRTAWIALIAGIGLAGGVSVVSRVLSLRRRGRMQYAPSSGGIGGGVQKMGPFVVLFVGIVGVAGAVAGFHGGGMRLVPTFNPNQDGDLLQRVASFGSLARDRNVIVRLEVDENALLHWQTHALTGWGVGAYGEVYRYPPPDTVHAGWISNLPIHVMYDSGLIGLVAFAVAMVMAVRRGIGAWRRSLDASYRAMVVGLLLALFGLLLAFQATDATWFAYPWVYLGLLEAAVLSAPSRRSGALA
ncbi:MAG TPA: O-antigen ligase family protein [Chloroflexota bacterium]|nr:O-antigen ligase family protein [Chloroflexota bacterium]